MRSFLCTMVLMLSASIGFAQWADLAHNEASVAFGYSGQNKDSSLDLTGVYPIRLNEAGSYPFKGWAGAYVQQTVVDGKVESQIIKTKVQGGFTLYRSLSLVGFVANERDEHRGIAGQQEIGLFLRPGVYKEGEWKVSGGAGNYVENTQVKAELGIKDETVSVIARGVVFTSVSWRQVSVLGKVAPNVQNPRDVDASIESALAIEVSDNLNLVIGGALDYESEPIVANAHWHSSWSMAGQLTF